MEARALRRRQKRTSRSDSKRRSKRWKRKRHVRSRRKSKNSSTKGRRLFLFFLWNAIRVLLHRQIGLWIGFWNYYFWALICIYIYMNLGKEIMFAGFNGLTLRWYPKRISPSTCAKKVSDLSMSLSWFPICLAKVGRSILFNRSTNVWPIFISARIIVVDHGIHPTLVPKKSTPLDLTMVEGSDTAEWQDRWCLQPRKEHGGAVAGLTF